MNNRAAFVDAMQGISEEHLIRHIKKKFPGREERLRKYTMAAAIYGAACLVAVLAIPLIIGGGDKPVEPGNDPVVIETVVTGTEGTGTVIVTEESAVETEAVTVETAETTTEETTTETTTTTYPRTSEPEMITTTGGGAATPAPAVTTKAPSITVIPPVTSEPPTSTETKEEPRSEESSSEPQSSVTTAPVYDTSYKDKLAVYDTEYIYGVEVTFGLDKKLYYGDDRLYATLVLVNRSQSYVYTNKEGGLDSFLKNIKWYTVQEDDDIFYTGYDTEHLGCEEGIAPGEKWEVTVAFDYEPDIAVDGRWRARVNVEFEVYSILFTESVFVAYSVDSQYTDWDEPTEQIQLSDTSVTRSFGCCDYTLTIDKDNYTADDQFITVTVTLKNHGPHAFGMITSGAMNYLDHLTLTVGGEEIPIPPDEAIDTTYWSGIAPKQKMSFTKEIPIGGLDFDAEWILSSSYTYQRFSKDEPSNADATCEEISLSLAVPHN